MATKQTNGVIQHLRRTVLLGDGAGLTDGQLLEDYLSRREEASLAALVRRHGPMVWGVCRRVLRNYHDAEDAFQATFLVLVRKAASIVPRELVGNWLYGVAHQTALKARATVTKRKVRERQVKEMPEPAVADKDLWRDLHPLLDEELSRLPGKYRSVIVLCDLEGKTRKEAARQLGCPEGTVAGWLVRARAMLAKRLTRHGVVLSGGALAALLSQNVASAGVPTMVVSSTIKAASLVAAGRPAAAGVISVKVAALTEGVLKTMVLTKLKVATAVVLMVAALSGGAGLIYQTQGAGQPNTQGATEKEKRPAAKPATADTTKKGRKSGENGWDSDALGIPAAMKQKDRPKTLEVRLRYVKPSDDKQSLSGIGLDRYHAELDDRGVPRTDLPTAKEIEVLIDGKKARITDLLPGDKIALQLSPDNKRVTKIELTLKSRLDALEKEAAALRERIKRLEKGK